MVPYPKPPFSGVEDSILEFLLRFIENCIIGEIFEVE